MKDQREIRRSSIFDGAVEVFQLESGDVVLSSSGAAETLTTGETGAVTGSRELARFLDRLPSKYAHLSASPAIPFALRQGGRALGITPQTMLDIMRAYSEAHDEGLLHPRQLHIARNCNRILRALTEVGLVKVCEEALGIVRADAATIFEAALFREHVARDSIWPSRMVKRYCEWNGIKWRMGDPHPMSMKNMNGFFYDMIFTQEIRKLVQEKGLEEACKQHQTLNEGPRDYLKSQLQTATSLALFSKDQKDWQQRMRIFYGKTLAERAGQAHLF